MRILLLCLFSALVSVTDFNGRTTTRAQDVVGRVTTVTFPAGDPYATVSYEYTPGGRRAQVIQTPQSGDQRITRYAYDSLGRLRVKDCQDEGTLTYDYDAGGAVNKISARYTYQFPAAPPYQFQDLIIQNTDANRPEWNYKYDSHGRLEKVNPDASEAGDAAYTYDDIGAVKTMTYRNGLVTTYTYNDRNWLRMMETRLGTTLKARFDYDNAGDPQTPWAGDRRLSPTGLRRSVQETIGSLTRTVDYDYDSLHRLIKENIQPGTSQTESVEYGPAGNAAGYDLVGNRRSRIASSSLQTAGITSFTGTEFNALDQPTDGRSFDHNGNTTSDSTGASYVYDAQNLLIRRTGGGLPAIELTYDADGNRVKRTVTPAPGAPADVTLFLVDELNPTGYAQVIEERDAAGTTRMSYVYGLDLISQKNSTGVVSYYGYDGLGSVRYLSKSENALITDTYTYDAFGILINQTGSTPNAYRYTGEQYDQHLGMYYLRARYYKPELGRFWTMDSYEGAASDPLSLHKYLYCHDNPMNGTDPSGHEFNMVGMMSSLATGEGLQAFKAAGDTLVHWEMRDMRNQLFNDLNPKDLRSNQEIGEAGEKVWCNYLNRKGFKALRAGNVSAVGPDLFAAGVKNGRLFVIIGEVKASKSMLPGVAKLKWNIMNGVRQMSYGWLNKYGSDIVDGLIRLGLQGIGEPQLQSMLSAGEIDLYLMGALKQRGDKWLIRGFELIHAGEVETLEGDGGLPDIVTEQKVNSAGFNIP